MYWLLFKCAAYSAIIEEELLILWMFFAWTLMIHDFFTVMNWKHFFFQIFFIFINCYVNCITCFWAAFCWLDGWLVGCFYYVWCMALKLFTQLLNSINFYIVTNQYLQCLTQVWVQGLGGQKSNIVKNGKKCKFNLTHLQPFLDIMSHKLTNLLLSWSISHTSGLKISPHEEWNLLMQKRISLFLHNCWWSSDGLSFICY